MKEVKDKRVYVGHYLRYDDKWIYVVMVVPDEDTGEMMVLYKDSPWANERVYKCMTKRSFCEMVEVDGKRRAKFRRRNYIIGDSLIDTLENDDLRGPIRKDPYNERTGTQVRIYRTSVSYESYAKDMLNNYREDYRKYKLCVEAKKFVGVLGREQFLMLQEDLLFLQQCLGTVLCDHKSFCEERFWERKSIRKYAVDHKMSRGSVEHRQKKVYALLAEQLKSRDEADQISRLSQAKKEDFE